MPAAQSDDGAQHRPTRFIAPCSVAVLVLRVSEAGTRSPHRRGNPQRRPDQFANVPHEAERESHTRGKSEDGKHRDLAALLGADLRGNHEEDPSMVIDSTSMVNAVRAGTGISKKRQIQ